MAYGLLEGKRGIIFGALNDMSIAWKVAVKAHEEGARFTLTNTPVALRLGTLDELAKKKPGQRYFRLMPQTFRMWRMYCKNPCRFWEAR